MRFKIRFAEQIVGVFVLLALALLALVLVLMGTNQHWFTKEYYFTSEFPSADGLSTGMAISFKGFQIGTVDTIALNPNNTVGIRFHIYETYIDKVTPNSVLELTSSPLGLGGGLLFHPGKTPGPHLPDNSFIPSTNMPAGQALVKAGLVEVPPGSDTISNLIGQVAPILQNINTTLDDVQTLIATINTSMKGEGRGQIGGTLASVQDTAGNVNALMNGITPQLTTTLGNLSAVSAELKKASESPHGMVQGLLQPKGSISTFLNDNNELYNQINSTLSRIDATSRQLQAFVQYLNSTEPQITGILNQGRQALVQGKDVLEGIRNNPLIRGGIPQSLPQPGTASGYRDGSF